MITLREILSCVSLRYILKSRGVRGQRDRGLFLVLKKKEGRRSQVIEVVGVQVFPELQLLY